MHPSFRLKFRPPLSGHLNGFARHHAECQSIDDAHGTETARSMNPARDFAAGIKTGDGFMRAHVDDFAFGRNQNAAHRVMDLRTNAAGIERRFGYINSIRHIHRFAEGFILPALNGSVVLLNRVTQRFAVNLIKISEFINRVKYLYGLLFERSREERRTISSLAMAIG